MGHQRIQPAVEALADCVQAPLALLTVQLDKHDCPLGRKLAPIEGVRGDHAATALQRGRARAELAHGAIAIDRQGEGQRFDAARQLAKIEVELPVACQPHCATGRGGLVEEGHVAVVRELACAVQPKAGTIDHETAAGKGDVDAEGLTEQAEIGQFDALTT